MSEQLDGNTKPPRSRKALRELNSALRAELAGAAETNAALRNDVARLEARLADVTRARAELDDLRKRLEARAAAGDEALAQGAAQLGQWRDYAAALLRTVDGLRAWADWYKQELNSRGSQLVGLQSDIAALSERLAESESGAAELAARLAERQADTAELAARVAESEAVTADLRERIGALEAEKSRLVATLSATANRLEETEDALAAEREAAANRPEAELSPALEAALREQITDLRTRLDHAAELVDHVVRRLVTAKEPPPAEPDRGRLRIPLVAFGESATTIPIDLDEDVPYLRDRPTA